MKPEDLKIGMYLTNEGHGSGTTGWSDQTVPVYKSFDGTGPVLTVVKNGDLIGQIVDILSGPNGTVYIFVSPQITEAKPFIAKELGYILDSIPGITYGASVNFEDIKNNVTDQQVAEQAGAIYQAEENGVSIQNTIKKTLNTITNTAASGLWKAGGIALGAYVIMNWKQFFKPAKTR